MSWVSHVVDVLGFLVLPVMRYLFLQVLTDVFSTTYIIIITKYAAGFLMIHVMSDRC